jgi:predicted alpha-1,2-mannosidase
MMQSLVNDAVQDGWLPRWPVANQQTYIMRGDSSSALLSSSYAFGARDFDLKTALRYMVKGGTQPAEGSSTFQLWNMRVERAFLAEYLKLGYVPATDPYSASCTLEYANDDFAIAQFAKGIGDTGVYRQFMEQSQSWKNLLDPATGWIRPRYADGTWLEDFDAHFSLPEQNTWGVWPEQYGFQEGNTAQYTFMIPFDYPAEFAAIGGDEKVAAHLDKIFCDKPISPYEACFNPSNEPDFATPYAYAFAGMPWKTQEVVNHLVREGFNTTPSGIPGNDDLGATSALYVWNVLGMYPAVPGVGGLVLGTPTFKKATIRFSDGRTLSIQGVGPGYYVQKVVLNGNSYPSSWLPLSVLHTGSNELTFVLARTPNKHRGEAESDRPPSFRQP